MRPRTWPSIVIALIPLSAIGCANEPSPMSPTAAEAPETHALATKEMDQMARRNREAEAAFYRTRPTARPAAPESSADSKPTNPPSTVSIKEKS